MSAMKGAIITGCMRPFVPRTNKNDCSIRNEKGQFQPLSFVIALTLTYLHTIRKTDGEPRTARLAARGRQFHL